MGRVRVNLASGSIFEKPLITCFKGTNGNYIVLDNETNGSMGNPIICIGRLDGSTISKIVDPTEWSAVKENLKTIIGGTALPYLAVPETLSASDEFYTQLTLPTASFDILKNTYTVEPPKVEETPVAQPEPIVEQPMADVSPIGPGSPIDITPIAQPEPVASPIDLAAIDQPPVEPVTEVTPIEPPIANEQPVPPVEEAPITFDLPTPPVEPVSEVPVSEPVVTDIPTIEQPTPVESTPVVSPFEIDNSIVPNATSNISDQDLKDMKETFMKSCENMFDALVEKLKK